MATSSWVKGGFVFSDKILAMRSSKIVADFLTALRFLQLGYWLFAIYGVCAFYGWMLERLLWYGSNPLSYSEEERRICMGNSLLRGVFSGLSKRKSAEYIPASELSSVKKAALRRGIWYKTLNKIERSVIDLTTKYVDNIRSAKLATLVTAIIAKLQAAAQSKIDKLTASVGFLLTKKASAIAVSWGNLSARSWAADTGFARYLAVMNMNGKSV